MNPPHLDMMQHKEIQLLRLKSVRGFLSNEQLCIYIINILIYQYLLLHLLMRQINMIIISNEAWTLNIIFNYGFQFIYLTLEFHYISQCDLNESAFVFIYLIKYFKMS